MGNIENRSSLFHFDSYEKCMKDAVWVEKRMSIELNHTENDKVSSFYSCLLKV